MLRTRAGFATAVLVLQLLLTACTAAIAAPAGSPGFSLQPVLDFAAQQLKQEIWDFPPGSGTFPGRNTLDDGSWDEVEEKDWVSGFMTGCLWKMHALTGNTTWSKAATAKLPDSEPVATYTGTHDLGFMIGMPYGNALAANPPPSAATAARYRRVMLTAAGSLAKRYNSKLKLIRSWGKDLDAREFKVIIDNTQNLDLLFKAAAMPGGKSKWRDIAVAHATRTAKDFFRSDGSTYHKVIYDAKKGTITSKGTHQGYSDSSTWTRGQAWALYGFTSTYESTKTKLYLTTAQRAADLFLKRLSSDMVPLWDFDAPKSQPWKDTSAGAVAAAGLLRLAKVTSGAASERYRSSALSMLTALATQYLASSTPQGGPALASILRNGTYSAPGGSYGTGTIFGDYYFLETLQLAYGRQA